MQASWREAGQQASLLRLLDTIHIYERDRIVYVGKKIEQYNIPDIFDGLTGSEMVKEVEQYASQS